MKYFIFSAILLLGNMTLLSSCGEAESPCTETTWYEDADTDGLGNPDISLDDCEQPAGYVANANDTDDTDAGSDFLINASLFNSASLISFERVTSTLEDGSSAECFQLTFSSNPVESGPFCPETINDVA
ncbi:MAG: hypothetical protein AAF985_27100, partial [Bacteroidota bacterium]